MQKNKLAKRMTAAVCSLLMLLTLLTPFSALAQENEDGYEEVLRFSNFEKTYSSGAIDRNIYADWTLGNNVPMDITNGHELKNLRLQLKFTLTGPQGQNEITSTWNQGGYVKLRSVDVPNKEGDPDLPVNGGSHENNAEHNYGWNLSSQSSNPIKLHSGENELLIPLINTEGDGYSVTTRGLIDWTQLNRILFVVQGKDMVKGVADHTMTVTYAAVVDIGEQPDPVPTVNMPTLFGNNMMFQQGKDMKVWGWAEAGETVEVSFSKRGEASALQTKSTTVGADGSWSVVLDAMEASYQEYTMTVTVRSGDEVTGQKTIDHILIGEVWAAGGQSNMAFQVMSDLYADEYLAQADNDTIRMFVEPNFPQGDNCPQPLEPEDDIPGAYWATGANDGDVSVVSSVAYHFALALQEKLDVPVGFLYTPVGGSVIEAWISRDVIEQDEEYKQFLISKGKYCDEENWPNRANRMSGLYNQKIGALSGYNVAGTIWYQGESNSGEPEIYGHALNLLRENWGRVFGYENGEDMPFVFTLVQPWITDLDDPQFLGRFAEGMYDGWKQSEDTDMAMISIYDLPLYFVDRNGNSSDPIHPRHKQPVGERFATAAYNMVYDETGTAEYTAPVFKSMTPGDSDGDGINDYIDVTFDHVGDGLEVINAVYDGDGFGQNNGDGLGVLSETEDVHGFAIAGTGGVYVNAKARITGKDTVRVWSDGVKNPVNVTYNFYTYYMGGTLKNSVGIPAIPFRSDRSDTVSYFNMQDWTYADANVWTCFTNGDKGNWADFLPSWGSGAISGPQAEWEYDPDVKAEGRASVKVTYTPDSTGSVGIGPVLGYLNQPSQFENFDTISVSVKNGDDRDKGLSLRIQSGGAVYTAAVVEEDYTVSLDDAAVAAGSDFTPYTFSLHNLTDEKGDPVAEPDAILKNVEQLQFTFADDQAGTVYLDDVCFGFLYDESVDKSVLEEELAQSIDESLYTEESVAAYKTIRQSAQTVMDDPVATQSQVNRIAQTLKETRLSLVEINTVGTFSAFERTTLSSGNNIYADWTFGDNTPIDLTGYDMNNLRLQLKFTLVMPDDVTETTSTFNNFGWIKLRSEDVANKPGDPSGADNTEHNYGWNLSTNPANPIKLHSGENVLLIPLVNTQDDGYSVVTRGLMDWSKVNRILMTISSNDMKGRDGEFQMIMTEARIVDISVNNARKEELQALIDEPVDTSSATAGQIAAYEEAKQAAQTVCDDEAASLTDIAQAKAVLQAAIANLGSLPGDMDGNGEVTASDALTVLQAATHKIILTDAQRIQADVDGVSGVNSADALLILQYATKKISQFPSEG